LILHIHISTVLQVARYGAMPPNYIISRKEFLLKLARKAAPAVSLQRFVSFSFLFGAKTNNSLGLVVDPKNP
jgi:hypothetical protein